MNLDALLAAHVPEDPKETADLDRMREFAQRLAAPFSRAQPEAHFTGSAVVITPDAERVLLLHHGKLNRWLQPGGHAEPQDEGKLQRTAMREASEETGLEVHLVEGVPQPFDVDVHQIPARKTEAAHFHLDVRFLLIADDPERLAHDPAESHGAQWLSWEAALERSDEPALTRMLKKARSLGRQRLRGS